MVGFKEKLFMQQLQKHCVEFIDMQYKTKTNHFLDGYISKLQLAIEFDEEYHRAPTQRVKDAARESLIQEKHPNIAFFHVDIADWETDPESVYSAFQEVIKGRVA